MFKKTLLAASVMAVASFGAQAASLSGSAQKFGAEFTNNLTNYTSLVSVASGVNAPATAIVVQSGKIMNAGDFITFNFSGVKSINSASLPTVHAVSGGFTGQVQGAEFADLEAFTSDDSSVTYRVKDTGNAIPAATYLALSGVEAKFNPVVEGSKVTFNTFAETANGKLFDESATSSTIIEFKDQFELDVETDNKLDGTIDVATGRVTFETDPSNDTLKLSIVNHDFGDYDANVASSGDKEVFVITGEDLSFILDHAADPKAPTKADFEKAISISTIGAGELSYALNADATELTIVNTLSSSATSTEPLFQFNLLKDDAASVLKTQKFNVSVSYKLASLTSDVKLSHSAGEWDMNGTVVQAAFVPANLEEYSIVATVANRSSLPGEITVVFYDNMGNTTEHVLTVMSKAKSVTDITTELRPLIAAQTSDVAMDIIVNAEDVQGSVIYYHKASQDRVNTNVVDK